MVFFNDFAMVSFDSIWFSTVFILPSYGFPMVLLCFHLLVIWLHRCLCCFRMFFKGFLMVSIGVSCGFPALSYRYTMISYGFPMVLLCFHANFICFRWFSYSFTLFFSPHFFLFIYKSRGNLSKGL